MGNRLWPDFFITLLCCGVGRYYNSWIENAEEQEAEKTQSEDDKAVPNPAAAVSSEESLLQLNKIEAPSARSNENNVEDSWWQEGEEPDQNESDSSSSESQESIRSPSKTASSKSHSVSFFSSKSESSEGVVFTGNADESVLQFGDLLDTEVQLYNGWSSLFVIRVNLLHPGPSLFLYRLVLSLWCFLRVRN